MKRFSYQSSRQRGIYAVEFSIAALVFFIVLFMVIEFGRLLYTWNVLEEITRRAARLGAVCPVTPATETEAIKERSWINGVALENFSTANIGIQYLNRDGTDVGDPVTSFGEIRFVRASIINFQYQTLFPLGLLVTVPPFALTLPTESLGVTPPGTGIVTCVAPPPPPP